MHVAAIDVGVAVPRVVLDFPATPRRVFQRALSVMTARSLDEVPNVIAAAEQAASGGRYVAGFLSYEAAPAFDAALRVRPGGRMPFAWFAAFDEFTSHVETAGSAAQLDWQLRAPHFADSVDRIREEIAAGRTYQVNLTTRLETDFAGDAFAYYEQLRRAQGRGYHAFIETDEFNVLSASPELFFEIHARRIRAKPMKGTRPRGRFTEEDQRLEAALATSEKDRAENLMIVDLLRNDIGRVAQTASVRVSSLYDIERYRTVHQMVSVVEAQLRADISLRDVFTALFPCGSVTGAPKISTMELIAELEDAPREVYCGAIGVLEPNGNATFSVPIRTVWIDRASKRAVYGTGAGITFDSDPQAEYREIIAKAAVLTEEWPEFELLETMRLEDGRVIRLEGHVDRLLDSAQYFGFAVERNAIVTELARLDGSGRVRMLVNAAGRVRVEVLPLDSVSAPRVTLARKPVDSQDRFLFHKTTNRGRFDQAQIRGYWDVLLWNERGEVTEFTRANVVVELDGRLLTPARECGLLVGVFRSELLKAGMIEEAVVTIDMLSRAERIWFINSLREWVEVEVDGPDVQIQKTP